MGTLRRYAFLFLTVFEYMLILIQVASPGLSGNGAADPDIKIEDDSSVEGTWMPTHAGTGDWEPEDRSRAVVEHASSDAVSTALPEWLLEDWARGEREPTDSPVPVNEARLFWDTEGNGLGGTLPLGRTTVAVDIPQLALVRMPRPGGVVSAPPRHSITQATEVDNYSNANPTPPSNPGTWIQNEDELESTLVNSGLVVTPFATEATELATQATELATQATELATQATELATQATEPDTPRVETQPVGHRWTFRALHTAVSGSSGQSGIPVSASQATIQFTPARPTNQPHPPRRRDAQPMVHPSGSRTHLGSRLLVPIPARTGAGCERRASLRSAAPSASTTQPGLLATVPDTPIRGRDNLGLLQPQRTRPSRAPILPRRPLVRPRAPIQPRRPPPPRGRTLLLGTPSLRKPPSKLKPIYEGAAGCGVEDGLPVSSSEVGYVADTRFGSSNGTERDAATRVTSNRPPESQAVPPSQLDFPTMESASLAGSIGVIEGLGEEQVRKRKAADLEPARSPCVTSVTQWMCGHSSITGVTHTIQCRYRDQVGSILGPAPRAPCPESSTRIVLTGLNCTECSLGPIDGRSEYVGGWVTDQAEFKRRKKA